MSLPRLLPIFYLGARLCSTNWAISAMYFRTHCIKQQMTPQFLFIKKVCIAMQTWFIISEEEETRTPTSQLTLPPQSSASTNSATSPVIKSSICLVPRTGVEPARLSALAPETSASTIPPPGHLDSWAENETRTRDPNLGKVVLYQLSYSAVCVFA